MTIKKGKIFYYLHNIIINYGIFTYIACIYFGGIILCLLLITTNNSLSSEPNELSEPKSSASEGTLTFAIASDLEVETLDPASYHGPLFIFNLIYQGLLEEGPNGSVKPSLAKSWEISSDGRTYVFYLREGVKFSNGTHFDSNVAVFNLNRWFNDKLFTSLAASKVESLEATGPYTLKIVFKEPSYTILKELAYPRPGRFIDPSYVVESPVNSKGRIRFPVGTGPFMLEKSTPEMFSLTPNPTFWGPKPKISRLLFKIIPDGQARLMALQSGEVDIAGGELIGSIPVESQIFLKNAPQITEYLSPSISSIFLVFNNDYGLFSDINFRQAIAYSIDRRAIATGLFDGQVVEATRVFHEKVPYTTSDNNYAVSYDPQKAADLFIKAGYKLKNGKLVDKSGKPLILTLMLTTEHYPEWKILGEYLQSCFEAQGIKLKLKRVSLTSYHQAIHHNRLGFDLALSRTYSDLWMPHGYLNDFFKYLPNKKVARYWTNPEMNKMVVSAMQEMDEKKRQNIYDKIFQYISSQCIVVPLYHTKNFFYVRTDTVGSFSPGISMYTPVDWLTLTSRFHD